MIVLAAFLGFSCALVMLLIGHEALRAALDKTKERDIRILTGLSAACLFFVGLWLAWNTYQLIENAMT